MTIRLPDTIARYFAADKSSDPQAIADCFTLGATVVDEGNTYTGRNAIRQWAADSSTQYTYTGEPFAVSDQGGRTVVTSHTFGNFLRSPADLRYFFVLQGDHDDRSVANIRTGNNIAYPDFNQTKPLSLLSIARSKIALSRGRTSRSRWKRIANLLLSKRPIGSYAISLIPRHATLHSEVKPKVSHSFPKPFFAEVARHWV